MVPIVIPAYNNYKNKDRGYEVTRGCLENLARHTAGHLPIIMVDGASDKRIIDDAFNTPNRIININPEPVGNVKNLNAGLRIALLFNTKYICIMNSDIDVVPGWLPKLVSLAETTDRAGQVVPTLSACGPNSQCNPSGEPRNIQEVTDAICSCVLFRTAALRDVGLYDEVFNGNLGREDTDMNSRMAAKGWKTYLAGDVCLTHHCSTAFTDIHGADWDAALKKGNELYDEKHKKG